MDIKAILSTYHNASESKKLKIEENVKNTFALLTADEQKEVQRIFIECQDELIRQGKIALTELKLKTELEQVLEYY